MSDAANCPVDDGALISGDPRAAATIREDRPSGGLVDGVDAGTTITVGPRPRVRPGTYGPALVIGAGVGLFASILAWWFRWGGEPVVGLLNLLVVTSFAMTAAVLAADAEQRTTAWQIGGAAACYILSWGWTWPPSWQQSPLPMLSFVGGYLWFVLLGTALTRYPHAAPAARRALAAVGVHALGGPAQAGAGRRCRCRTGRGSTPPPGGRRSPPPASLYDVLTSVFHIGLVGFVLALLAVLVRKIRRGIFVDRVDALPAVVAAASIALAGVAYLVARVIDTPPAVQDLLAHRHRHRGAGHADRRSSS